MQQILAFAQHLNEKTVLIASVLIAGLCSIVYELLISTTASYFLGDSIKQFSITIGVYMAAMGVGSFLSRLVHRHLLATFIAVEIALGMIGGLSVPLLYVGFAYTDVFYPLVISMIITIGALTGLEVPLLTRIMDKHYTLKVNLSNVLSLDYLGALLATLAFPFLLVPLLGVFKSALLFGLINMSVGFLNLWVFADNLSLARRRVFHTAAAAVVVVLGSMLAFSEGLLNGWSNTIYEDRVIHREQTPYQNIVLTRYKDDVRLYLSGNLQFSSLDEYRYHEPLVHVPAPRVAGPLQVLVLGGGDGLAVRELLKYPSLEQVTLVDLDPAMLRLARENAYLRRLNGQSLSDPRVQTLASDAFVYLQNTPERYNLIIADLPDPKNVSLARLYSREFYKLVRRTLSADGVFVTQATSPFYANRAFWSIHNTLATVFAHTERFHNYVPAFGDWGFVMAAERPLTNAFTDPPAHLRFLNAAAVRKLFVFEADLLTGRDAAVSSIDNPKVLDYYLGGWEYWK